MGLIEKAGEAFAKGREPEPQVEEVVEPAAPTLFDLDFNALAQAGFYTPTTRSSRLSLELRSIKRRLLRRLGIRNAAGERKMIRRGGRQRNLVLVTSTRPGEGKTFTAANLALSLALEEEMDVLLIDADLPRPKVRATFGLKEAPGLSDRLRDPSLNVASLCRRARQASLSILSEGALIERPAELYSSAEAQRLFTELSARRSNRIVIIDAPPVLATDEAAALAAHVDEVIFVVEADATPEAAAAAALDEMLEANPNVSLVLNRCLIGGGAAYYGSYDDYDRTRAQDAAPGTQDEGTKHD